MDKITRIGVDLENARKVRIPCIADAPNCAPECVSRVELATSSSTTGVSGYRPYLTGLLGKRGEKVPAEVPAILDRCSATGSACEVPTSHTLATIETKKSWRFGDA